MSRRARQESCGQLLPTVRRTRKTDVRANTFCCIRATRRNDKDAEDPHSVPGSARPSPLSSAPSVPHNTLARRARGLRIL